MSIAPIKNIRVRKATERDKGLFRKLWLDYLEDRMDNGAYIAPTDSTLIGYENIFNSYVTGEFNGIILFVADCAVMMCGDSGSYFDHTVGKVATNWGSHVTLERRGQGIGKALQEEAFGLLREMKFDVIMGPVLSLEDEEQAAGWKQKAVVVSFDLNEKEGEDEETKGIIKKIIENSVVITFDDNETEGEENELDEVAEEVVIGEKREVDADVDERTPDSGTE